MSSNSNITDKQSKKHRFVNVKNLAEFERQQYGKKKQDRGKMKYCDIIILDKS